MSNFVSTFSKNIFKINSSEEFKKCALELFSYQYHNCPIYKQFVDYLSMDIDSVKTIEKIPFLPIEFFKSHLILSSNKNPKLCFESSATTGSSVSKHYVCSPEIYKESFTKGFNLRFGNPSKYAILALLPSYLERTGSSLVYMVNQLIKSSTVPESGFFLHNHQELYQTLTALSKKNQKTILFGVTFALLDFVEHLKIHFPDLQIVETGGMKGRREEITRTQLHDTLCSGFGVKSIFSEYGMTELLSQGYSHGALNFSCPPWMKVLIREPNDPFSVSQQGKNGVLNIIDLANIESCAFIATQDLGTVNSDGTFEVSGRFDNSDVRGCNLMVL